MMSINQEVSSYIVQESDNGASVGGVSSSGSEYLSFDGVHYSHHAPASQMNHQDPLSYYTHPVNPIPRNNECYVANDSDRISQGYYGLVTSEPETLSASHYVPQPLQTTSPNSMSDCEKTSTTPSYHEMHTMSNVQILPASTHYASHHRHPYSKSANHHHSNHSSHLRKRKSSYMTASMGDGEADDKSASESCSSLKASTPTEESSKKQNHSEIEKRRRDKMNTYITELSALVPMCSAMSRKLDKLTVLRMAVQHMKTLRGSRVHSYTEGHYKPSFVTDNELKHLILQSAEGFLFVVGCDRGRLLYVSESVSQVLNFSQSDLLGQSWFDILHPKDVSKVKEQLSSDLAPRERLIDAKTMLPVKGSVPQKTNRLCPGARRSFFCRMKCKSSSILKDDVDNSSCQKRKKSSSCDRKFSVIHCTGYLKSWAKVGMEDSECETEDPCNLSCLVAVGRVMESINSSSLMSSKTRAVTFISRHSVDGKYVFVDQRTTIIVGYLPQELLSTSMYEYFHPDDIGALAEVHKSVLVSNEAVTTQMYRYRTRLGDFISLQSTWKAFRNPWTKDIECIVAKNMLSPSNPGTSSQVHRENNRKRFPTSFDFLSGVNEEGANEIGNGEIQRLMSSEVQYRKIGEQIADEVIDTQRRNDSSNSSSPVSSLLDPPSAVLSTTELQLTPLVPALTTNPLISGNQGVPDPSVTSPSSSALLTQNDDSRRSPTQGSDENNTLAIQNVPEDQTGNCKGASKAPGNLENSGANVVVTSTGTTIGPPARIIRTNGNNNVLPGITNASEMLSESEERMLYMIEESVLSDTTQQESSDGNDEAAMAVIMSLLEADAGLGGPVDFSGLPWPLP